MIRDGLYCNIAQDSSLLAGPERGSRALTRGRECLIVTAGVLGKVASDAVLAEYGGSILCRY